MSSTLELRRFQTLCAWMTRIAGALAIALPTGVAALWLYPGTVEWIAREQWAGEGAQLTLTPVSLLSAAAISCTHVGLLSWALWATRGLFARFALGEILEAQSGRDLRTIGGLVTAYAALTPVAKTLLTLVLTVGNPPGQRLFAVTFGTSELILGVLGALLLVLSYAMAEASRIADDNRKIV